ncbi:hypothetical protein CYMTET_13141 [Cymbomonas tetramitiformis]|uniref:Uncharacterized protein n=1 Tax=Cymbomonas tetramitiformis TaxID=36881 RepID=A0AAE0GJ48_9CHLO|nr:hypothetical protein CYMTET_13141 [Cymbomonas tetramitiformis]
MPQNWQKPSGLAKSLDASFADQKGRNHPRLWALKSSLSETVPLYVEETVIPAYIRGMNKSEYVEYLWWTITSFLPLTMGQGGKLGYSDRDDTVANYLAQESPVAKGGAPRRHPTLSYAIPPEGSSLRNPAGGLMRKYGRLRK